LRTESFAGPQTGIVTSAESGRFQVQVGSESIACVLRGRLKQKWLQVTSLVVVGDLVIIAVAPDGTGAIEAIAERRTKLSRPGFHDYEHIMAANLDQLLIVVSVHSPPFKRNLVDRFLLAARQGALDPVLVVNKCDLEDERVVRSWLAPFGPAGVTIVLTSILTGQGLPELAALLRGRISALAGQSGVGKSSLLNAMYPDLHLRTQGMSIYNKGRHTTTSSRLYALPDGGYLADTPGVKELALFETNVDELGDVYPEINSLAGQCKFRDCTHTHEPRCAVRAAVMAGALDETRYQSFVRLQQGR